MSHRVLKPPSERKSTKNVVEKLISPGSVGNIQGNMISLNGADSSKKEGGQKSITQNSFKGATKIVQGDINSTNSSLGNSPKAKHPKVKSERAHYTQQTTIDLQPLITPVNLVEVSVKRGKKPNSGSRANASPPASSRNVSKTKRNAKHPPGNV